MRINIDLINTYPAWKPDEKDIIKSSEDIFKYYMTLPEIAENCCLSGRKYNKVSFDFIFCNGEKTHEINKQYRSKDYSADIITFATFADCAENEKFILNMEIYLGEVIIALDKITEQAQEKNIDKESELKFFISHGLMHLLGFDHQTEKDFDFVIKHQKSALKSIGINYDKI